MVTVSKGEEMTRHGIWRRFCVIAVLGAAIASVIMLANPADASKTSTPHWSTVSVQSSTHIAEVVMTTKGMPRMLIEASGATVTTEWSGVCLPRANGTRSSPGAGTTTTPAGTTSTVGLSVQFVWTSPALPGFYVPCSVAAYAVVVGHGSVTIKVQVFVG